MCAKDAQACYKQGRRSDTRALPLSQHEDPLRRSVHLGEITVLPYTRVGLKVRFPVSRSIVIIPEVDGSIWKGTFYYKLA